jgi:hypothetical protein
MPVGEAMLKWVPHAEDPRARQKAWKALHAGIANGVIAHVCSDPDYPEFVSIFDTALNLLSPNPDYMYTWTPIDGAGIYRIRGFRNTARFVELSFLDGWYTLGNEKGTLASLDLDSPKVRADTFVDVIVSNKRPPGYEGDWFALPAASTNIFVRSAAYDWVNERDAILSIERMDVPASRPRASAEATSARLAGLASWVATGPIRGYERFTDLESKGMRDKFLVHEYQSTGGAPGQAFVEGLYSLQEDEALIMETEIPKSCRYWSFLLTDDQFGTVDWTNRQSSLNGFQAKIDRDGKIRAVIAMRDPGVANWLDTGGYGYGVVVGRWNRCSSTPIPTLKRVKLADVRENLPPDTTTLTAPERDASLRERRMGAQFRRKW